LWHPFQGTRLFASGAVHGRSTVAVRGDRRPFHMYHKPSPVAVVNSYWIIKVKSAIRQVM